MALIQMSGRDSGTGSAANAAHEATAARSAHAAKSARASRTAGSAPTFTGILWSFLKLAPISFGGGYAIFPAMEKEIVARRGWMDERSLAETLSLASAAPGGVGVNAAFLIGYRLKGIRGAAAAGIGAIVPTFALVLGVFLLYRQMGDTPKIRAAMEGITWGIITLILYAALRIGKTAVRDKLTACLILAALVCLLVGVQPLYLIVGGALIGFAVFRRTNGGTGAEECDSQETDGDSTYMYYI